MDDERQINWLGLFIKIVIVFIFLIIIVWLVSKIINNNKPSETFKNNINNMEEVALSYFKEIELPTEKGKSIKITLEDMIEKELILSINAAGNNACDTKKSYSKITREKKEYKIETKLKCGKEEDTITRKLSFKDYEKTKKENTTIDSNKENKENKETTAENPPIETPSKKTTYYEYKKENTNYSKWMRGELLGENIENKYEYYKVAEQTYYTLGTIEKNKTHVSYTIKLNNVPNKEYYFTVVEKVEYLNNDEKEYLSQKDNTIVEKQNIKDIPTSITKYSLLEDNFQYKLTPYYRKGEFYINVDIEKTKEATSYKNIYFIPLKITIKFSSPEITDTKPNGDYEKISYYRYVEKTSETKWSTETELSGYTKTGKTKEQ